MAHNLGSLVFTPLVQALHEKYGSRRHYARIAAGGALPDRLGLAESAFIAERDSFHMATVGATGWPYVQHRGGLPGFLKIIDNRTLAFSDFRGNKQFVSTGVEWVERLRQADYPAVIERVYLIRIEAFDWNCSQHITPRFTADQIQEALKPFERRLQKRSRRIRRFLSLPKRTGNSRPMPERRRS